jgi:hypothetical protein
MEESGEYRVTQHGYHQSRGLDSKHAKVVYSHLDEGPVMAYHNRHQPVRPGVVLACWRPDGSLIAFTSGGTADPDSKKGKR